MKVSGLKYLAKQGVENIWKNRMMSFASFCVLLVSLLLVGVATLFYMNISSMMGGIENKNEIIVYLDENTTQEETSVLKGQLSQIDNVAEVNFYSKEESFEDLKNSMDGYEMLFDSLGDDNPLVDAYRLRVKNIDQIADTIVQIESLDHIYSIRAPMDFVNLLMELRRIITIVCSVIIVALIVISLVIIANTTKASVFARRSEIQIMKYVGATNAFIRIPFFVEGMVTGFLAGCVAFVITWVSYDSLINLVTNQTDFVSVIGRGSIMSFGQVAGVVALAYIGSGVLFGALGSVLSMRKHLNV
ncbi:permease-like cell division protein FtsX [Ruminococcus sp.]|uniref:permease-like cell division protein FtsX n=1 Tax=Ruminococcus sp. TaxID=41978 RepID=UPI003991614C